MEAVPEKVGQLDEKLKTEINKIREEAAKAAEGLRKYKTFGEDSENPYEMNYQDFDKIGIYEIIYGTVNTMPKDVEKDLWVFNLYGDNSRYSAMISTSPNSPDLYFGKFVDGVWQGWKSTSSLYDNWIIKSTPEENLVFTRQSTERKDCAIYIDKDSSVTINKMKALNIPTSDDGTGNIWLS